MDIFSVPYSSGFRQQRLGQLVTHRKHDSVRCLIAKIINLALQWCMFFSVSLKGLPLIENKTHNLQVLVHVGHRYEHLCPKTMCGSRGGIRGSGAPEKSQNVGFFSNTGPDPLKKS